MVSMLSRSVTTIWTLGDALPASLYQRLSDLQKLSVLSGLAVIATAAGFLILFTLVAGRIARWYMHRRPRTTRLEGDPFRPVVDSKPRPGRREVENWHKPNERG